MSEVKESADPVMKSEPLDLIDFYNSTFTPEEKKQLIQYIIKENRHSYKYSKKLTKRVSALKKLQRDYALLNCKFYRDLVELERKYEPEMKRLYETRRQIVSGEREPTDDEILCSFPVGKYVHWHVDRRRLIDEADKPGVPSFWKFVLTGVPFIRDMCRQDDFAVLEYLEDVSCELTSPPGFSLLFHFASNPYFTNKVLRRDCLFRTEPDTKCPFQFEGAEILENNGCTINWNPGMNVTVNRKEIQVNAAGDYARIELRPSFFKFFDTSCDRKNHFTASCIASYFRERVIPKAVLFFTGEAFVIDDDTPCSYETDDSKSDNGSSTTLIQGAKNV